jgi:hypothetical protein
MTIPDTEGSAAAVPLWVRALDALALLLVGLFLWTALTNDARAGVFDVVPRVRGAFLLYSVGALLLVRHIVLPRPTTAERLRYRWRRIVDEPMWGPAVRAFVSTRLMVFVVGFFAVVTFGLNKPGFVLTPQPLYNLPARFDAGYYGAIAVDGYDRDRVLNRQRNIAFFPAMPMLMRAMAPVVGANRRGVPREHRMARMLWGGVIISLAAFLLALYYLMKLGTFLLDEERARYAVLLAASYPFACYYNAPYTESLLLLGTVAASYHFLRGQFARAAAWGLLVGLTRPNGFFLSVPLGLLALQQLRLMIPGGLGVRARETTNAFLAAAMPVVGMLAFTAYLYTITGVWFAWQKNHEAWGRRFTGFEPLTRGLGWVSDEGIVQVATNIPFDVLNTAGAAFALLMVWPVFRRVGAIWAVYVLITVVPPILAGGALSLARLSSTIFPLFLALAAILPSRAVPSWVTAFAIVQGFCAALFFTWRELF